MVVTMGEGGTPLVESRRIAAGLYFKLETTNPSGSYKDRFIAAELTQVLAEGKRACVATSSGNTGSSLAAYCARYAMPCVILVNADAPSGKLMQMQAHGAVLLRIRDFVTSPAVTEAVFAELLRFRETGQAALVVSAFRYCPVGMQGVKGIAREIVEDLSDVEHVFVPAGSGGLFAGVCEEMGRIAPGVKVHAVQPSGCGTIVDAYREGRDWVQPVESTTRISGLSVPFDIDGSLALRMLKDYGGMALGVSDEQVFAAQREMLKLEGIYSEPAGATALAGYRVALELGLVRREQKSVCLVTGHGFKDPASIEVVARETAGREVTAAELAAVLAEVSL